MTAPANPSNHRSAPVELSVILPIHDEQDNIAPLLQEIDAALTPIAVPFEVVAIDDGSDDRTPQELQKAATQYPWLRIFRITNTPPGRGLGLSAAFQAGIRESRGELLAFLDADLQNDPADLPDMIRLLRESDLDLVQGDRSAKRRDNLVRRASSSIAKTFRRCALGDVTHDTGCSLRVLKRPLANALPLHFKGMHRFIPYYATLLGYQVQHHPVHHRPRFSGRPKYGILNRALPGFIDLIAVRWMSKRHRQIITQPQHQHPNAKLADPPHEESLSRRNAG